MTEDMLLYSVILENWEMPARDSGMDTSYRPGLLIFGTSFEGPNVWYIHRKRSWIAYLYYKAKETQFF